MTTAPVGVVGSLNVDRYIGLARLPEPGETVMGQAQGTFPGGKGLNQAVAASRCGAAVRMCGAVGADVDGVTLFDVMVATGIDARFVETVSAPTGVAHVYALTGGENSIVVTPGANLEVSRSSVEKAISGCGVVLVQLEIEAGAAEHALREARKRNATTVLNAAPAHPDALGMLRDVDILIVNDSEAAALGGIEVLRNLVTLVHTRGAEGVAVYQPGESPVRLSAYPIRAVDTSGAGDAFCGGFVAALAEGASVEDAARRGAAAGAITAQYRGAQTASLTREAVAQLVGEPSDVSSANR